MSVAREERQVTADFGRRYCLAAAEVDDEVERRVLGGDYGANGYTTSAQARLLEGRLDLGPGRSLLDLGAGCIWPGLYLARRTGCRVVSTDLPIAGLLRARRRSETDRMEARSLAVRSSARALPFRHRAFDAVVHAGRRSTKASSPVRWSRRPGRNRFGVAPRAGFAPAFP